jgi:hypothetical protein
MTQVAYAESGLAKDTYGVQLSVKSNVNVGTDVSSPWDLNTKKYENTASKGGLFELEKASSSGTGTDTLVDVAMSTGKLSFVTKRTAKDELDKTKGVQLLTITYTVAIDSKDAVGEVIKGADGSQLAGPDAVQDVTISGSTTVNGILDSTSVVS